MMQVHLKKLENSYFGSQIISPFGNFKISLCGNVKFPKIASAEGFELFSCLRQYTTQVSTTVQLYSCTVVQL